MPWAANRLAGTSRGSECPFLLALKPLPLCLFACTQTPKLDAVALNFCLFYRLLCATSRLALRRQDEKFVPRFLGNVHTLPCCYVSSNKVFAFFFFFFSIEELEKAMVHQWYYNIHYMSA